MLTADLDEGDLAYQNGETEKALEIYLKAWNDGHRDFRVCYNLGVVYRDLEQYGEALKAFERGVKLRPEDPSILNNLGIVRERLGDSGSAVGLLRGALGLSPEFASAEFNLGMLLLRLGHYKEGFARCEARWDTDQFTRFQCPHPKWDGTYLDGTLLIHTEQGAGDAMQFSRYLPLAADHCRRIMFVCPERLMPLFSNVPGVAELRTAGDFEIDSFQAYTPLLSLPWLAGTTLDSIPAPSRFVTPSTKNIPLPKFGPEQAKLKVGISWAGSRTHLNDRNRSASLRDFSPLLDIPGISFYSLQVDESAQEIAEFPDKIYSLKELQGDWSEAATLIRQLDLVISVDTGVIHLAGSLGVPTWVALSEHADWRWLEDRSDTPWYPSMRLFRQKKPREWAPVFEQIRSELASLVEGSQSAS
ncbi:MAG: tetratricopeptide repeat-containing glycosyltransferase family protein [Verrucomicrobiales bacterium]|nr:tetratricopeptide repeat-containing glycosyltransferase family protein [Verrucomicrobiales bacterium]